MSRLLFFGDSFVQGNGLPDIPPQPDPGVYSKLTFPTLTANIVGIKYSNFGFGGTSICDTTNAILKTPIRKNDIVFAMWPDATRVGLIRNRDKTLTTMLINDSDPHVNDYYRKYWSEEKSIADAQKNIAVANVYVHQHGAEFINIPGVWTKEPEEFAPYVPEWLNRFYITKSFAKFYLDSVPDGHYGPETHKGFAEYLAQILIDRHLIK